MPIVQVEFNTIITFLGMLCATVQGLIGYYAAYTKKKVAQIKVNDVFFRAHRAFGSFATTLYLLGLFAGINGLLGGLMRNDPPVELSSASYNFHTWGAFLVLVIFLWKTWLSYFNKKPLYGKRKWLGIALFVAWSYNWVTAAISYYVRTVPPNKQHPDPVFLLPYRLLGVQLVLPFLLGGIISYFVIRAAVRADEKKTARRSASKA
jgi:hypothetical protein